ncbi:replication protein [Chitinimonas lacunae]|uniref:Replication protein n=1 Tax=Chitinimonas lacunae TaxID=1963018 RepID=A0ABV8MX88_9NEIS
MTATVMRLDDVRRARQGSEGHRRMEEAGGFVAIPNAVFDALLEADLPGRCLKIALAVVRKTYGYGKAEGDDCTIQQLADLAGIDRSDASRAFHALVDAQVITARKGRYGSVVAINDPLKWDFSPWQNTTATTTNVAKHHAEPWQNTTHNRQLQQTKESKQKNAGVSASTGADPVPAVGAVEPASTPAAKPKAVDALAGFDAFWAVYPKRKGKALAQKAWQKLAPDADLQAAIVAAVERQRLSLDWQKDGGQYIPHPSTWLNAAGWLDEDTTVRPSWTPAQAEFVAMLDDELSAFVVPPSDWTAERASAIDSLIDAVRERIVKRLGADALQQDPDLLPHHTRAALRTMAERLDPAKFGIRTFDWWIRPENRDRIRARQFDRNDHNQQGAQ